MAETLALSGRRLGEFEVLDRVAAGGFGEVFRARQANLGRDAVIKVLSSQVVGTARERFIREAQLASQLDHPFAAHIYAFGIEQDGLQWIAMELVRGISLAELLKAQGPLPVQRFVPLFQAICQVVQVAHEQGIVHRDLKPANVMVVARAGVLLPKLLDFGIARLYTAEGGPELDHVEARVDRLLDAADGKADRFDHELEALLGPRLAQIQATPRDRTDLTSRGAYLGSPPYMAPELWLRPHAAGPPCDIYALGILAFECLTGRQPYGGDKLTDIARAHLGPLPALGPSVPAAVHDVLARAVAKKAKDRFPDALALSRAVEGACKVEAFQQLPRPPSDLVAGVLARAPQPLAETVAAAEASTRAEDAQVRYVAVLDVVAQYLGVLAFASWCRLGKPDTSEEVRGVVRRLVRGGLDGAGWLDLAAAVTKPFARIRDAFPLPELVDLCHPREGAAAIDALRAELARPKDRPLVELVDGVGQVLASIADVFEYDLAVRGERGCEKWSGARRRPRQLLDAGAASDGAPVRDGEPLVLDRNHAPVVSLWPLAKAIAPTAAADPELFLVAGPGRYGARLVAHPYGFERQDPDLASWLDHIAGDTGSSRADDEDKKLPYRGLASFAIDDSELFFGRERESENLANHLRARAFAAVVGPSGAGKSSFVQAGVVPLLPKDWRTVVMRPGATPIATLFERLAPLELTPLPAEDRSKPAAIRAWLEREARRRDETLVIYVDQSEELVTLCRDDAERAVFAQVCAGVRDSERVRIVMTMRDDFLMRLQRLPGLGDRLTSGIHLLGTPSPADLRRILVEPARRMGYDFEDEALVDEMVNAVADNPSALALLSFTAARLWELRDRQFKKLRRKVYKSIGGVGGALAQHAEEVITAMPAEERELVREAFRHLVTADGTRAVISKAELLELLGANAQAQRVIESLVNARLAVTGESSGGITVEVTHEALLESWPRLVTWRREDAEHARMRDQLRASARQWEARARQRGLLWTGDVLVEYRLWRTRYKGRLSELEEAFGAACLREQARGIRRRRVLLAGAFAVLSGAAVVLYVFGMRARASAADATAKSIELLEEQGRRELLDGHPLRAAQPLARAYAAGGNDPALRFMLSRAMTGVDSRGPTLRGLGGTVRTAVYSQDGTRVVTASDDKLVALWDAATGTQLAKLDANGPQRLARTRDRALVVTAWKDEVAVRRTNDLEVVTRWPMTPPIRPTAVAIAEGGRRVVVGDITGSVHVLTADGVKHEASSPFQVPVTAVAISADGETWAASSADGHLQVVRKAAPARDLVHGPEQVQAIALTADGAQLASGGDDGVVKLWPTDGDQPPRALHGHAKPIRALAFSGDGTRLASASDDTTLRLWSVAHDAPPVVLAGHEGLVFSVAFDDAGYQLASASSDGSVRLWDGESGAALVALDAHTDETWTADFDATGAHVVSGSFDHTARLWTVPHRDRLIVRASVPFDTASIDRAGDRIATAGDDGVARVYAIPPVGQSPPGSTSGDGKQLAALGGGHGGLNAVAISPDGTRVVTGATSGAAFAWTLGDATPHALEGSPQGVTAARFSPDGSQLVLGGGDGVVRVLAADGSVVRRLTGHTAGVWGLAFSADGKLLATSSDDRTIRLWDAATGQLVRTLGPLAGAINAVAFDPAGRRLAATGDDRRLHVFALADGSQVGETLAHNNNIVSLAFSRDGERIVTASADRTAAVWDARTLRELARLNRHTEAVTAVAFQPGTDRLISAGADGALWLTELSLEQRPPSEISRLVAR
ncbi:MAG: protein kinase domain-containing protein [Acidobacteriota bacterium]